MENHDAAAIGEKLVRWCDVWQIQSCFFKDGRWKKEHAATYCSPSRS